MPLSQLSGTLGKKRAAHLLRRVTFGPTKKNIDDFAGLTIDQALAELFQPIPEPAAPIDPVTKLSWVNLAPTEDEEDGERQEYFKGWWLGQMLANGIAENKKLAHSAREKIVFFLHTHFTTIQETVGSSRALYFQNALLRKYALDESTTSITPLNLKELTKKICVDNAMLVLLDGRLNVKGSPNENFGRELLELYSIGKGLPGNIPASTTQGDYIYYTEQDVQAAAKVLSGFNFDDTFATLDLDTTLPRGILKMGSNLLPSQHDNSEKTFSFRFGNAIVKPDPLLMPNGVATSESVFDEINQLITMIFNQNETAKNICRKLYRFFIYHDITTDIDDTTITNLATTFKNSGYKIEPVIKEIVASELFFDAGIGSVDDDNFGSIIKSPLDITLGTLKFFEYPFPDYQTDTARFYAITGSIISKMRLQGMNLLNPYDVAGYEAYHQYPIFNRNWISTNTLTERYKLIFDIMKVDDMPAEDAININVLEYVKTRFNTNALDPDLLLRELIEYLLPMYNETSEITTKRLNYFRSQFLEEGSAGGNTLEEQINFWKEYYGKYSDTSRGMLQDLVNALLQSPEYQLF